MPIAIGNLNLVDLPLFKSPRCESCGGDTHYPDPLCSRCFEALLYIPGKPIAPHLEREDENGR